MFCDSRPTLLIDFYRKAAALKKSLCHHYIDSIAFAHGHGRTKHFKHGDTINKLKILVKTHSLFYRSIILTPTHHTTY